MTLKKEVWASTTAYDPFFDKPKIGPTLISLVQNAGYTFTKLPVHALINDLKKEVWASTMAYDPFFDKPKI